MPRAAGGAYRGLRHDRTSHGSRQSHHRLANPARALHVFGELERLKQLLDSSEDSIGLALMDEKLPQRVRSAQGP